LPTLLRPYSFSISLHDALPIYMQVGVGVLSLPYDIFVKAKNNGWLSVIITGLIIQTILLLFHLLMSRFPEDNIFDISKKLFGKFFGNICIFLFYLCYEKLTKQFRSEEHTSELQSRFDLVCRLLLEKKKQIICKCLVYHYTN